jgi:hypothetical protein
MTKQQEYARDATQAVQLAQRATSMTHKRHLLKLAEAWLDLADRAQRRHAQGIRKVREHPLLRAMLGREQSDA